MTQHLTLEKFLDSLAEQDARRHAVTIAVKAFADASVEIADLIGRGALAGVTGKSENLLNAGGDVQKDLDVRADAIIRHALKAVPYAAVASEEGVKPELGSPSHPIAIAYDPLDGSSNIETNMAVGTIFSILPHHSAKPPFAGPGSEQLAAGFIVYGPQTSLILTLGDGVVNFLLDRARRTYILVQKHVRIPVQCAEFAINASNRRHWEEPVRAFIDDCLAGVDGPCGKDFNMRWIASLVAEVYRILVRGGIFLYPADARKGYRDGRLRLLYEAHPMAFIIEQAGGGASTGRRRILDLSARSIHQKVPLIVGSLSEVRRIEELYAGSLPKSNDLEVQKPL